MKLINPQDWPAWLMYFSGAKQELDKIVDLHPLHMEEGQVLERNELEKALCDTEEAFKDTAKLKDRINQLMTIANRWRDQEYDKNLLKAGQQPEFYPNQEAQKAFARIQSAEARENYEACKVLMVALHDERSRLYQYRETLINLLHGVRQDEKMAGGR